MEENSLIFSESEPDDGENVNYDSFFNSDKNDFFITNEEKECIYKIPKAHEKIDENKCNLISNDLNTYNWNFNQDGIIELVSEKKKKLTVDQDFAEEKNQDLNVPNDSMSKVPTSDNTSSYLSMKKIFNIEERGKSEKKIGRKKKRDDENIIVNDNKKEHTKNSVDNMIRKIKVHSMKFAKKLVNNCIKKDFGKLTRKKIRSIKEILISDITIKFNIEFFNSTLERIFSNPINNKYKGKDLNQNIIEIKKIKEELQKGKLTKELLNKTLKEVYDIFVNSEKEKNKKKLKEYGKMPNTKTLNEFLLSEKKNNDTNYIEELKKWAINIYDYFDPEKARKSKKKNNKFIGTNFQHIN